MTHSIIWDLCVCVWPGNICPAFVLPGLVTCVSGEAAATGLSMSVDDRGPQPSAILVCSCILGAPHALGGAGTLSFFFFHSVLGILLSSLCLPILPFVHCLFTMLHLARAYVLRLVCALAPVPCLIIFAFVFGWVPLLLVVTTYISGVACIHSINRHVGLH